MRALGYEIACLCLFAVSRSTTATDEFTRRPEPGPVDELMSRTLRATDIVVTDADGRVLESWRGELKPGEVARLGLNRLTPANALPLEWVRLRPNRALSGFYDPQRIGRDDRRRYRYGLERDPS